MDEPTTATPPLADKLASARPAKKIYWKWSLAITAAFLAFLMWQCGSALYLASKQSNAAVRDFHRNLNDGQFEQIYLAAHAGFSQPDKHNELVKFLEAVHRKLGVAQTESLTNLNVKATTEGTYIYTVYNTTFAKGPATETFTWVRQSGKLKLYGYDIQSRAFIVDEDKPAQAHPDTGNPAKKAQTK